MTAGSNLQIMWNVGLDWCGQESRPPPFRVSAEEQFVKVDEVRCLLHSFRDQLW